MYENYRMPGEFEKRSNVYVTWLPDYIRAEGYDNRQPCIDVIKALLEYGDVTVNLNCGTPGSYEEACSRLKEAEVISTASRSPSSRIQTSTSATMAPAS